MYDKNYNHMQNGIYQRYYNTTYFNILYKYNIIVLY